MHDRADDAYMLSDAPYHDELARLLHLEAAYGPRSRRLLADLGVAPGWKCLEVGAGAGDVARWLAERVGPAGSVVATDLDTRFLARVQLENLTIRRHDIARDALESAHYDLVHCRMVLAHIGDTAGALARMVSALRPGGIVLVEEPVRPPAHVDPSWPRAAEYQRILTAILAFLRGRGADAEVGRRVPRLLASLGVRDIEGELTARVFLRPPEDQPLLGPAVRNIRAALVAARVLTEAEVSAYLEMEAEPDFSGLLYSTLAVWGRSPA